MFPKFQKPKLPTSSNREQIAEKFELPEIRHPMMREGASVSYPGGPGNYTGKFEKPHMHKPRVHKRY